MPPTRLKICGAAELILRLAELYKIHDQDTKGISLDKFFDTGRHHWSLQEYLTNFEMNYDKAETGAGLTFSKVARTHLLMKRSGLLSKRIINVKLHFTGDLTRFNEIFAITFG